MFERLFPRRRKAPVPLPQPNAQLALGALLVRVAFADDTYRAAEIGQIDRILSKTFGIGPIEAAKLRAVCEKLQHDAPDTDEFARILREEVDYAHRLALGQAMWTVALADGHRHEKEEIQLLEIETALGLTETDIEELRRKATGEP